MEVINVFSNKFKSQIQEIYKKDKKEDDTIILVNYQNPEDIKLICTTMDTVDPKIVVYLEKIKKNSNEETNDKFVIVINDKDINIVKYLE